MSTQKELVNKKAIIVNKLKNAEASLKAMQDQNIESDANNIHRLELKINAFRDVLTTLDKEIKKGGFSRGVGNIVNKLRGSDPVWKRHMKEEGIMNASGAIESFGGFMESLKNGKNDQLINSVMEALSDEYEGDDGEIEDDISEDDYQNFVDEQGGDQEGDIVGGSGGDGDGDEIEAILAALEAGKLTPEEASSELHRLVGLTPGGMGDAVGDVSGTENTMGGSQTGNAIDGGGSDGENALDAELEKLKQYLRG